MKVQRLTMDTSWWLEIGNTKLLIDPWLVGPEIDGFKWLNIQWHKKEPLAINHLPEYDYIVVSQSYSDHCHIETLKLLPADKPILATPKAYKRLKPVFPKRNIQLIKQAGRMTNRLGELEIAFMHPGNRLDPVYFSLLINDGAGNTVFYSPHGFKLNANQQAITADYNIKTLFTTFTDFRLPSIMGGHVNPGLPNVNYLLDVLQPQYLINTHDEEKKAEGLVNKLAKVSYPNYDFIQNEYANFQSITDYQLRELG